MRTAIISDTHANIAALEAVLDDAKNQHVERTYCLGDLVGYAPFPNEVIDWIQREAIPTMMGTTTMASGLIGTNVDAPTGPTAMIGAAHRRIEGREYAVWVVAVDPDVAVEVRLEHVRFIDGRVGIIGHRVVRHTVERRAFGMAGFTPGVCEHQVFDGDQFERTVSLRFVNENARRPEIRVGAGPI